MRREGRPPVSRAPPVAPTVPPARAELVPVTSLKRGGGTLVCIYSLRPGHRLGGTGRETRMGTRRRLLALALAVLAALCVAVAPAAALAETLTYGDFKYKVSDGKVTITDYEGTATDVEIPASIDGMPVTVIANRAFYFNTKLKSVTIPSSVTSIEGEAFLDCRDLEKVSIPSGVTSIGAEAFRNCYVLKDFSLPTGLKSIGEFAFYMCYGLSSVSIPSGVTSISEYAFGQCAGLESVQIAPGVTSIGRNAFEDCESLTDVGIPSTVTSIGKYAFSGCSSLASVSIPSSVTSIDAGAFSRCSSLASVSIPSSVTSVADDTFYTCTELAWVAIPSTVTSIEDGAFYDCYSLTDVYYGGSVDEWKELAKNVAVNNARLLSAAIHYNSDGPGRKSGGGMGELVFDEDCWPFYNTDFDTYLTSDQMAQLRKRCRTDNAWHWFLDHTGIGWKGKEYGHTVSGASCYGMSLGVSLNKVESTRFSDNLHAEPKSEENLRRIAYYYQSQYLPEAFADGCEISQVGGEHNKQDNFYDQARLKKIEEAVAAVEDGGVPPLISLQAYGWGAHTVVGYKVEEYDHDAEDQEAEERKFHSDVSGKTYDHRILLYDCNNVDDATGEETHESRLLYNDYDGADGAHKGDWEDPDYYWGGVTSDKLSVDEVIKRAGGDEGTEEAEERKKSILNAAKDHWAAEFNGVPLVSDEEDLRATSCRFGRFGNCYNNLAAMNPDGWGDASESARAIVTYVDSDALVLNLKTLLGKFYVIASNAEFHSDNPDIAVFYGSDAAAGTGEHMLDVVLPEESDGYEFAPAEGGHGSVDFMILDEGYYHNTRCADVSGVTINADGGYDVSGNRGDVKVETTLEDGRSYKVEADEDNTGDFSVTPDGDKVRVEGGHVGGMKVTVETDGGEKTYTVPEGKKSYTTGESQDSKPQDPKPQDPEPVTPKPKGQELYRLFDPSSGEHLYTTHMEEVQALVGKGWDWERAQTMSLPKSGTPVWRLFDPRNGDHHYTSDAHECRVLTAERGWVYDFGGQPAFYGAPAGSGRPVYRIYDTRAARFGHLFTADANERRVHLSEGGWDDEGVAWRVQR